MRIAVVGSGISGSLAARLLADEHEVVLFEADGRPGGHTHTVDVDCFGETWSVDTGFMVFNQRTYPRFCELMDRLHVASRLSDMSFSVSCAESAVEYQGSSLNGLFAQRRNLGRPSFWRMLTDIARFNLRATRDVERRTIGADTTVGAWLDELRVGRTFVRHYLVPMAAAIWSARPGSILEYPAEFLLGFFRNHGLLQLRDRPQWRTIPGGARRYLSALLHPLGNRLRLRSPVSEVRRESSGVTVCTGEGGNERFDHVVLALHADQALRILGDATPAERKILSAFPYQRNEAWLHTDTSWLPSRRAAWASWNYRIASGPEGLPSVTYDLSRLQGLPTPSPLLLTLNPPAGDVPAGVLRQLAFEHPGYGLQSRAAQRRHHEISGLEQRTSYCGAYWGFGFHEDGVQSALAAVAPFGKTLASCTVASTREKSGIAAAAR